MMDDFFQSARRDGALAIEKLSLLPEVNIVDSDGQTLLHTAIAYANDALACELIHRGINVNAQDRNGLTPLHFTGAHHNSRVAEVILQNGGDLSVSDCHENSPLWTAVFNARGDYSVVNVLLKYGASSLASKKNRFGRSPLDFAAQIGDADLVGLLQKKP